MDDYVLVSDDHTEVKNEAEVGKLLLMSDKTPSGTFSPSQAQWLCGYRTSQRKASPPTQKVSAHTSDLPSASVSSPNPSLDTLKAYRHPHSTSNKYAQLSPTPRNSMYASDMPRAP